MKKITDFIINKRYMILVVFLIFACLSAYLATKVNINDDITKYLPVSSETRIGMDIMEEEFTSLDNTSSLSVMFKNLEENEKNNIYEYLKEIEGVDSVNYNDSEDYNKDGYTLFVVNVNETSDSNLAKDIYLNVTNKYEDYELYMGGSIASANTPIMPSWIMIVSITCAVIILLFMCESYLEPFLFLFSILVAVILNSGTNIIFGSVSVITNSIAAILQMALSMDYSIMLMNRFREECKTENNKIIAMKNALYHSFSAISSSSLTTIVGLITLVFMSFTIGRDLGLVLAKGVLLSLVSIFLCLPTLILIFDKLITKTKKKTLNIKLDLLGKISYKVRYPLTIIFVLCFIGSYFLKGNLGILYTSGEMSKIDEVFGVNNQMAVVYNSKDEDVITKKLNYLEDNNKINSILSYSNTINEKLKYNDLTKKMNDLGTSIAIDDYLFKILYYFYYNTDIDNKMTMEELVNFIENVVYKNNKIDIIDDDIKSNISKLKYFVSDYEINKKRNVKELASILGLNSTDIEDILIYYNSKNNSVKLTVSEFLDFITKDVLSNKKYAGSFNEEIIAKLDMLGKFTNEDIILKEMNAKDLGLLFGTDEDLVIQILLLKYQSVSSSTILSISEFINEVLDIKNNTNYLDGVDLSILEKLAVFVKNENNILTTKLNKNILASIYDNISYGLVDKVYMLAGLDESVLMTPQEFINLVLSSTSDLLDADTLNSLNLLKLVIDETLNGSSMKYNSANMAKLLNIEVGKVNNLYALIDLMNGNTSSWVSSPKEFVNLIISNQNNALLVQNIDSNTWELLKALKTIMDNINMRYDSNSLSTLLGINKSSLDLIYGLYTTKYVQASISLNSLVTFVLNDVAKNSLYASKISTSAKSSLEALNDIMKVSLNGKSLDSKEMYTLLRALTSSLDKNMIDLLYVYYGSEYSYQDTWELTIEELVKFLNDDVVNDDKFKEFVNSDMKDNILKSKDTINTAKSLLVGNKYSRVVLNTGMEAESLETFNFIKELKDHLGDDLEYFVVGDSPMAYEMSQSFVKEFNYISILTMIAIFIVVAITFKSILIPFILVLLIQCAVYLTMGILSFTGESVYFIAILVVQSILMGATIDYAILYTSYYLEYRAVDDRKLAIIEAYNSSIHTILTSASILVIVTLILGLLAIDITAVICKTIAEGTLCSAILILLLLPGVLATFDRFIVKRK